MNPNQNNYRVGDIVSNAEIIEIKLIPPRSGSVTKANYKYLLRMLCCPKIRGCESEEFWYTRSALNTRKYKGRGYCRVCAHIVANQTKKKMKGKRKNGASMTHEREPGQVYVPGWGVTLGRMGRLYQSAMEFRERGPYKSR